MSRLPKTAGPPVSRGAIPRTGRAPPAGPSTSAGIGVAAGPSGVRLAARAVSSGYGRPTPATRATGVREVTSKAKITVTKPTGERTTTTKADRGATSKVSSTASKPKLGAPIGPKRSQATVPIPPPSVLRKQVALQVKGTAAKAPIGSKVTAVAAKKTKVPPLEKIMTPAGPQQVIQKVITEKRVERSKQGEVVSRNIKTIETDPQTGETTQVEEEVQKLNPDFAIPTGPIKEIVTIVNEMDITNQYEATTENVVRETTKLDPGLGMDPQQVSKLVDEENEDVQNALKINPPELVNQSPERYPLKKRLQALRLSPENIALLEQSVIQPPISADEPLPEASPEVMARVMNAMDKSMQPKLEPEATFNTLFAEGSAVEPAMALLSISSVAPGPLGDVVVPNESVPESIQEEMLSRQMEEASVIVQTAEEKPTDFSFSIKTPVQPKKRERKKWGPYKPISSEDPPWQQQGKICLT
ncbi:hypothetical protein HHI36_007922 [Cryptolaemus montrouzieri]|uniref:Uncharacterized protein n=1 Tax=Cryptolaemus montrouzieri TaxID=559131 RepID=A0ABD2MR30_9CUCU